MSLTARSYWDHSSNRFIEVESLFDGRALPWQDDRDPSWRNSGSYRELMKRGGNHKEFLTATEVKGKSPGKAWKTKTVRRHGMAPVSLTEAQIAGVKLEFRHLSYSELAKKYGVPRSRVRSLVREALL